MLFLSPTATHLCAMFLCDVPVAGGATYIQLGDGSEYILVVNQGLWFGEELEVSLKQVQASTNE